MAIVLEQIIITCSGIFDKFLHPIQEFRLKNDTLKTTHPISVCMVYRFIVSA